MAGTLPRRESVIIRGAWVLTMGAAGALENGAVHIADGVIRQVGSYADLRREHPTLPVVGDGFGLVIPGLVNAHTHLSEALIPGMGSELTLYEWGERLVTPVARHLTAEMARKGTVLKAAEMIRSGVTFVNDMFVHSNPGSQASMGVLEGLVEVGMRGMVSFGAEDSLGETTETPPMSVDEVMQEHQELSSAAQASELVGFRYGIGTLLGQSDELLEAGADACRTNGWPVHTHLCEVREEIVHSSLRWSRRPIQQADRLGFLDVPLIAAHAIWVRQSDIDQLAEAGGSVVHNPVANMILGAGVCPLARWLAADVSVGIGTDGAASNDSQNMLEAVKMAALLQKVHALDPAVINAREVLEMATLGGARALGIQGQVGSLETGKRADLVCLRPTVELAAIHDPYQQVVYCAGPRSVGEVWVDGRRLLADGHLTTIDEPARIDRARELARSLARQAGLEGNLSRL
ncbi:MAG: amidohydrolase family protein [Acidimicrobiia bacterium]|nr:amidohydrolase family protein [bacterium]MXX63898.1 amidohydrolase family protein [Acidimicrobiia bacterium]MCY3579613.1 amidohydrolase family protein [bacterium]MCY3652769.1 amidohydrolase family protein [bacterium]MDE0643283.1 amidohydrolase family protein [bacterium]